MDRTTLLELVFAGFAILIALGILGWMLRRRRQRTVAAPVPLPADLGDERARFDGFYVATTRDGRPLDRIAVHGLGFRARAGIAVTDAGVVLELPGREIFVPREDIREVTTSQYAIDRVVEAGGLVLLAWTLGEGPDETPVDTYLRVPETSALVDAIRSLLPLTSGGPTS